jgi:hypothetical protein
MVGSANFPGDRGIEPRRFMFPVVPVALLGTPGTGGRSLLATVASMEDRPTPGTVEPPPWSILVRVTFPGLAAEVGTAETLLALGDPTPDELAALEGEEGGEAAASERRRMCSF